MCIHGEHSELQTVCRMRLLAVSRVHCKKATPDSMSAGVCVLRSGRGGVVTCAPASEHVWHGLHRIGRGTRRVAAKSFHFVGASRGQLEDN